MMEDVEDGKVGICVMKEAYVKQKLKICENIFWKSEAAPTSVSATSFSSNS